MHGRTESRALAGTALCKGIVEIPGNPSIAYYISSHGYGHGVRSCSIIRAINNLYPQLNVRIVSKLPLDFLTNHLGSDRNSVRAESFDIGMVQIDSIRVDVAATLARVQRFYAQRKEHVEREAQWLLNEGIRLIVADIPALPFEAAARAGIPRLAVGNFGWDWIYSEFVPRDSGWKSLVDIIHEEYAIADLLLRLPFCEEMSSFPKIEDIPLVASPGKPRRAEIAGMTGCDPGKKWSLLSFTTLEWDEHALAQVERIADYEFFTVRPLEWRRRNFHALNAEQIGFSDVLASMDAVITKPGFGIVSDCIVNRKPLIYADRTDFLEYAILEASIRKHLRHVHIPTPDLYRGDLQKYLDRIWESPAPLEPLSWGGDRIAARRIAQFL
jgi:hypothetical protein